MAEHGVAFNRKVWFDGYDFTGNANAAGLVLESEPQDATVYGLTCRKEAGGLMAVRANVQGFWEGGSGEIDDAIYSSIGLNDKPFTIAAETGADGEIAYSFKSRLGSYEPGARAGEMLGFRVEAGARGDPAVRGTIMHPATARTTTSSGTARQLGGVLAGEKMYAALHVIAASGSTPTLDVAIESDTVGFGSPTVRINFAQATAIGGQWASVAGAITDDYWRATWTIGGGTPSFTFIVILGIR